MIHFYGNIEAERDRIEACIKKLGWTSDHNLDWFLMCQNDETGKPFFAEFEDGSGLLAYKYPAEWSVWSDPLCGKNKAVEKIVEFLRSVVGGQADSATLTDVSDDLRLGLGLSGDLKIGEIDYSLFWPVMDMSEYDPNLPGGRFKEIRNAKNKFYKKHKIAVINSNEADKKDLHRIVDDWKKVVAAKRPEIYDLKYHRAIDGGFKSFLTSRVLVVDDRPAGFSAGYEVSNNSERFAGIIGVHDYSFKDLGEILWLDDLGWVKNAGYKEFDMQGSEDDGGLKLKLRFGAVIERKTDTFSIEKQTIFK